MKAAAITRMTDPPCGTNSARADRITIGSIEYPTRLKHLYKSKLPFRPASMLNTVYKKTAEMVAHPRIIPKWIFPESNWKSPKAKKNRNGPERSASKWRSVFVRNGMSIEIVLLQICFVLMPSSSRRGGSSSKFELAVVIVGPR